MCYIVTGREIVVSCDMGWRQKKPCIVQNSFKIPTREPTRVANRPVIPNY